MTVERFPSTSRYSTTETVELTNSSGDTVPYLRRRFVPSPERFADLTEHEVTEGDRVDTIAAQYLGDPQQFWRVCDANGVVRPEELTATVGRRIRITLPEGMEGSGSA